MSDDPEQVGLWAQNAIVASTSLYPSVSCKGVFVTPEITHDLPFSVAGVQHVLFFEPWLSGSAQNRETHILQICAGAVFVIA